MPAAYMYGRDRIPVQLQFLGNTMPTKTASIQEIPKAALVQAQAAMITCFTQESRAHSCADAQQLQTAAKA